MAACVNCGAPVSQNEIGLSKKLISRDTKMFYCLKCLAERFDVTEERLIEKIAEFKKNGCMLFV